MLLLVVLLSVMIYQLIAIRIQNDKRAELDAQIAIYKELYAEDKDSLEARKEYWWIVQRARELGYMFDGDELYE